MFDIGFIEILFICVVALLVLGPERLPGAVRTIGLWVGRLKRSFNNIRADIEREVGADEIRRQLRNEAIMDKIKNTKTHFQEGIDSVKKEAESVKDDLSLEKELNEFTGKNNSESDTTPPPSPEEEAEAARKREEAARSAEETGQSEDEHSTTSGKETPSRPAPDGGDTAGTHSSEEERTPAEPAGDEGLGENHSAAPASGDSAPAGQDTTEQQK